MHREMYSGAKYEIMGKLKVPMQGRLILRTKIRHMDICSFLRAKAGLWHWILN